MILPAVVQQLQGVARENFAVVIFGKYEVSDDIATEFNEK